MPICLPIAVAPAGPDGTELLLVWVALFAAYFLPARVAWLDVGLMTAMSTAAVVSVDGLGGVTPALCLGGTSVIAVVIVSSLRSRLADLLATARRQAQTDVLTGLLNRAAFDELFAHEAARCHRADNPAR